MNNYTHNDIVHAFTNALADFSIAPRESIAFDTFTRFHVDGDSKGSKNGFYILHSNGLPAGHFGCNKRGINQNWCIKNDSDFTDSERSEFKAQIALAKTIREKSDHEKHHAARIDAEKRIETATPYDHEKPHTYLINKNVQGYGVLIEGENLLIPARDVNGKVWTVQTIAPNGDKRFQLGGAKKGNFHLLGKEIEKNGFNQLVILAEGYATAATCFEALGEAVPTAVCFDSGNLEPVALALREKYPRLKILIAGDNDAFTENNAGKDKAQKAAYALTGGAAYVIPDFLGVTESDINERLAEYNDRKPTDFNDMAAWLGAAQVREQLENAIEGIDLINVEGGELPQIIKQIDWKTALKNNVAQLNKEYAIVLNSTKTLVMKSTPNEDGRLERVYLSLDAFRNLYLNELIKTSEKENKKTGEITDIFDTKANAWLRHYDCVKYKDGVIFEPSIYANGIEVKKQIYGNKLNLWQGYSVPPIQGERGALERIYYHITHVICNDDDACIEYLFNWIARCLQYPEKTGQVAVVMKGIEGCGKGTLARFIKDIFGQHGLHITNAKHLVGNFNGHLSDCCFLFADEAFFAGNKEHENIQKGLITEPSFMVERKGVDAISMTNRLKIMMASNHEWVAPTTKDGRRYFVLDVSSKYAKKKEYFAPLNNDINNAAVCSAFLSEMLHRDISDFDVSKIPDTAALQHQREQSLDTFGQYWLDVLHRGYVYDSQHNNRELQNWINEPATDLIRAGYEQWLNKNKITQFGIVSPVQMGRRLSEWYVKDRFNMTMVKGENSKGELLKTGSRPYCYKIGTRETAILYFCTIEKLNSDELLEHCD